MKKVYSILAVAVLLFAANIAKAQTSVNFGYIQQSLAPTLNGNFANWEPNIGNGFFIGGSYNYAINKGLGVNVGVNLQLFTKSDTTAASVLGIVGGSLKNRYNEWAVSVPVFFNYNLPLGNSLKLKVFAGPIVGFTFSSKCNWEVNGNILGFSGQKEGEIDYLSDDRGDNALSPLSIAVAGGVGLDFNNVGVNVGYSYGLTDRYGKNDNVKSTYTRLFVGINYNLK